MVGSVTSLTIFVTRTIFDHMSPNETLNTCAIGSGMGKPFFLCEAQKCFALKKLMIGGTMTGAASPSILT